MNLGYVIGGGKLKIDVAKMEAITKWPTPTNVNEVRRFWGGTQYLYKFIYPFMLWLHPSKP